MIILVPFFGNRARFRPLLDRWVEAYRSSGARAPWYALSDDPESYDLPSARVDASGFADLVRVGQPFDVKGALVCAALLRFPEPLLVLDADAFLERDPAPALAEFAGAAIAMPIDDGALTHDRAPTLSAPFSGVKKLCAGVLWFGASNQRGRLVAGYRRAFEELVALPSLPWAPPLSHLVEQHAWSICAQRRGGKVLPRSMNWQPRILGDNPLAVVNHHYGRTKWVTA